MTDTMKEPSDARVEAVARAICTNCDENPDHAGDARGNAFRWQDYRDTAIAAIRAADADAVRPPQAVQGGEAVAWISERNELLLHHPDCYGRGDEQWRALYTHHAPAPAAVPVDAIREVIRISDRLRPAWDEVNAWLATSPPTSIERGCDEAMRKDAERYRWLRSVQNGFKTQRIAIDTSQGMDAAIDAAMAAASNQKGALNE